MPSRGSRAVAALAALVVVVAVTAIVIGVSQSPVPTGRLPVVGVLEADPSFLAADGAAGIRLATLNLSWARWEPGPGRVDSAYRQQVIGAVDRYRLAGWEVAVDIGLQQPPGWALGLPGGRLLDQRGQPASTADFEFSASVRHAAAGYLADVVHHLGTIAYYRVGLSENGEAHYPDTTTNQWWAATPQAQGTAPGLPAGVRPTPLPGWVPGTTTWRGRTVTPGQVTAWYAWYFGAMVGAQAWEIAAYRSAGYQGQLELVVPGTGALPAAYQARLASDLAPSTADDFYGTLNTGAVWWKLLDDLPSLTAITVDVSSIDDGSGTPRGNTCQAGDAHVDYLRQPQVVDSWSDARWLTYLAGRHGLPVMGENPGNTPGADLPGIVALVRSCHLVALQWAWDYQLRGPGPTARLDQLGGAIRALTGAVATP